MAHVNIYILRWERAVESVLLITFRDEVGSWSSGDAIGSLPMTMTMNCYVWLCIVVAVAYTTTGCRIADYVAATRCLQDIYTA